ncbi:unnamed protein product [Auanema sp. JU1783]|nr:unnamed protein product [Auanema sp. JU1783]
MSSRARPESSGPPDLYYNEEEAKKYARNSHIIGIQAQMSERALELLAVPEGKIGLMLDIEVFTEQGHAWIGVDVSLNMLKIAKEDENDNEDGSMGDFIWKDMGTGMPFRPGTFDGAISISAIQWLCHANAADQNPRKRLHRFFQSLYACLGTGTRAVFQFYPENEKQTDLIMSQATKAGFHGGLVVDFPESTRARKVYLVLMTGGVQQLPKALTQEEDVPRSAQVDNLERRTFVVSHRDKNKKPLKHSKAWIQQKRDRLEKQGKTLRQNSKYSGRKRKIRF